MATRLDFESEVATEAGGSLESAIARDPLTLRRLCNAAVNEVARRAECYLSEWVVDIEGTAEAPMRRFCIPHGDEGEIFKIKLVTVTLSDGTKRDFLPSDFYTALGLAQQCSKYPGNPESGNPTYLVVSMPHLEIYPNPNYTVDPEVADGIVLYGFGTPGRLWNPESTSESDDDVFPLPPAAWDAAKYLVIWKILALDPTPLNQAKAKMLGLPGYATDLIMEAKSMAGDMYGGATR
jgi:hypothetical protein